MASGAHIRMVIVTASPNDAERIGSHLRNAGHVVHADWISDIDPLDGLLPQADLVLCASDLPRAKLKEVAQLSLALQRPVPVIALNDAVDIGRTTQAMRAGARDLVSLQQMEHLQAVVLREFEHVQIRRALHEASTRLQQAETRHDSLLQDSTEALAYIQEGIHIRVNPAYARLFGFSDIKSVEGLPLMDLIVMDDRPQLKQHLRQVTRGHPDKTPQAFRGLNLDGSHFRLNLRFTPTQVDDEDCIEILAIPEAAPKVEIKAGNAAHSLDVATGFAGGHGRQSLYTALDAALKTAGEQQGMPALLFLRVDNMERMEQRLGFDLADRIFNELAAYLLQSGAPGDHSYRFSASEFVMLAHKPDSKHLEKYAKVLQTAVSKQVFGDKERPASLTVSISVLPLAWHSDSQEILREARQQAINLQSRQGSGIYMESPRQQAGTEQQQEKIWVARIKTALEQNRLRLIYKSIVNLEGESSHYLDALVRMIGENGEEIHALEFVPIAERHDLIQQVDQWVVLQALLTLSARQVAGQEFGLFVRMSDNTIAATNQFLPWLLKQIKGYPARPEGLFLTYSESGLLDNLALAKQLFTDLKTLKIRTAISRFGVSPQAQQLLEQLPVDFVRLDAAAIKALINPKAGERISEVLKHARQKGIRIVAKQVTDAQTMAMLWTLGVHFIEGDLVEDPPAVTRQAI